jgi:hypothetical protein
MSHVSLMPKTRSSARTIPRPALTFSSETQQFVQEHYAAADVILEYGSGGSTVLASEMRQKTIFSVESSRIWARKMRAWFAQAQPPSRPVLHHVDIGPTGKWGTPIDTSGFQNYHRYPLSIWERADFVHPDVILIDGRFRVACAFAALLNCTKRTVLLFDDYEHRRRYHVLEDFADKQTSVGNMAKFVIEPEPIAPQKMTNMFGFFANHF